MALLNVPITDLNITVAPIQRRDCDVNIIRDCRVTCIRLQHTFWYHCHNLPRKLCNHYQPIISVSEWIKSRVQNKLFDLSPRTSSTTIKHSSWVQRHFQAWITTVLFLLQIKTRGTSNLMKKEYYHLHDFQNLPMLMLLICQIQRYILYRKYVRLKNIQAIWVLAILLLLLQVAPCGSSDDMNTEYRRLHSFQNWPYYEHALPSRLARAGFYYTRQSDQVQCFSCSVRLSSWQNRGSPWQEHVNESPNCPFVTGTDTTNVPFSVTEEAKRAHAELTRTGRIPVGHTIDSSVSATGGQTHATIISNAASNLPGSISNVPNSLQPSISNAPNNLQPNIFDVPNNLQPSISDVPNNVQPSISDVPSSISNTPGNLPSLSIPPLTVPREDPRESSDNSQTSSPNDDGVDPFVTASQLGPRHPEYATQTSRVESYSGWPSNREQTPQLMADSGFFYSGVGDSVRCFNCHGGLQNWLPGDLPWVEHARWFPRCRFVSDTLGTSFIQSVANGETVIPPMNNQQVPISQNTPTTAIPTSTGQAGQTGMTGHAPSRVGLLGGQSPPVLNNPSDTQPPAFPNTSSRQSGSSSSSGDSDHGPNAETVGVASAAAAIAAGVSTIKKKRKRGRRRNRGQPAADSNLEKKFEALMREKQEMEERNRLLKEAELCAVCMDEDISIVFLPCGHRVTCPSCAANLRICPMCRTLIRGTVKSFLV